MKTGRRRLTISFAVSLLIHALVFSPVARQIALGPALLPKSRSPITVALNPKPPPTPSVAADTRALVDVANPTDEPVGPTDLIAEQNAKAHDLSDRAGQRLAPAFEDPSEFDRLVGRTPAESARDANPLPPKPKPPDKPAPQKKAQDHDDTVLRMASLEPDAAVREEPPAPDAENGNAETSPNRRPSPTGPGGPPGEARGRVDGGVLNDGFVGFEALKSEIAPYLKKVRTRVEQKWFAAMTFRYRGVSPTKAVVDCAINRQGKLVHATLREEGGDAIFARIGKESIEQAAPFPPFPFDVPDIYASKDLEIRWTFSFMN